MTSNIFMTDWLKDRVKLGRTDLLAGRLGMGASYMAPAKAWEAAYEAGCNYFYWGALRMAGMAKAIRNIIAKGKREDIIIVLQAYIRPGGFEWTLQRGLKRLGINYADILLLGWYNKPPNQKTMDRIKHLKDKGLFRYLGISGHHRPLFAELANDPRFDLFMLRYNAAHRGAEEDVFPHLQENRPGIVGFTATSWKRLLRSNKIPGTERRPTAGDCYRFVLSNPNIDVVITGPSNEKQMLENLTEVAKGPMTEEELEWMRRIGDHVYGRK